MKRIMLSFLFLSFSALAQEKNNLIVDEITPVNHHKDVQKEEPDWGIALGARVARIPFAAAEEDTVGDVVPKMYFEGKYLFMRGETGGIRFWDQADYNFSLLGRYRYFDVPSEYQKDYHGSQIDTGLQLEYFLTPDTPLQAAVLSDSDARWYGDVSLLHRIESGDFDIQLDARYRYKSDDFNNTYYGLNNDKIGSDHDIRVGTQIRYHVFSNLYLLGEAHINMLGNDTYQSHLIDEQFQTEYYLGFGFFNDKKERGVLTLPDNHYLRVAYGLATPANLGEIMAGQTEKDEFDNKLTSLFYGVPIAESLFGFPIEFYVTPGVVYHFNSEVQDPAAEYVLGIKAYYTFTWPVRWRAGVAEGLSYATEVSYIEWSDDPERKNTKLLNYLDFSVDINLGDVTTISELDNMWLGYSIHHRSAMFETNSLFGRSKGGSNYNTVYLQWHF